jgi:hypothetical protein
MIVIVALYFRKHGKKSTGKNVQYIPPVSTSLFCINCGTRDDTGSRFCTVCGGRLDAQSISGTVIKPDVGYDHSKEDLPKKGQ